MTRDILRIDLATCIDCGLCGKTCAFGVIVFAFHRAALLRDHARSVPLRRFEGSAVRGLPFPKPHGTRSTSTAWPVA